MIICALDSQSRQSRDESRCRRTRSNLLLPSTLCLPPSTLCLPPSKAPLVREDERLRRAIADGRGELRVADLALGERSQRRVAGGVRDDACRRHNPTPVHLASPLPHPLPPL